METRKFRGMRTTYEIQGNPDDAYFNMLPDHDLGGLVNYMTRLASVRHIRNSLDIGANIGLAALLMAEIAPSSKIFSFEPSPRTYGHLVENIGRNQGLSQISPQPFAVGDSSKKIRFFNDDAQSHANHIALDGDGIEVEMKSIDDFVYASGLSTVDFIKIDIEGFELPAFQGAVQTLLKFRPVVLFEFNEYAIIYNAHMNPLDYLTQIMNAVGAMAVVNSLTGEATALPCEASQALAMLQSMKESEVAIFDLANQII